MTKSIWTTELQARCDKYTKLEAHPPVLISESYLKGKSKGEVKPTLQRISLELTNLCNLKCKYCYSSTDNKSKDIALSLNELKRIVDEAIELGAKNIVIVGGGEPFLNLGLDINNFDNLIDYINSKGSYVTIYSNCTLIDKSLAKLLYSKLVSIVGKLNSLNPETQDFLAGKKGAFIEIMKGIDALLSAGFTQDSHRLALDTVICRQNYDELPKLWRWMRKRKIIPYFEIMTIQGNAKKYRDEICFSEKEAPEKYRLLFEELLNIDRTEFGYDWIPHPPHVARTCNLYYNNCYINSKGGVQPCAGVDVEYGRLQVCQHKDDGKSLREIIESKHFKRFREIEKYIGEPCKSCELLGTCYGCRGNSWNLSGNIFDGDLTCWRKDSHLNNSN